MYKVILFFLFMTNVFAYEIINGKTFLLEIEEKIKISKDNIEVPLLKHPTKKNNYFVLVPVDYKTQDKEIKLLHVDGAKSEEIVLHVKQGNYKKETLKVNPKKVKPPKSEQNRIYKEYLESKKIYTTVTKKRYWSKPFLMPLNSKITSEYGNARIYNGTLKGFHSGTDFRAPTGTKLNAVNDGVVVVASERYYSGNAVILDHGEGIYSSYSHLSKINVKKGQHIKQGQSLGLSGATGRVTGPHLHFSIIIDSKKIDPLDFIKKINMLF